MKGVNKVDDLKSVLCQAGVFDWLREQFPSLSERELLAAVDGDFERVIGELGKKGPRG